MNLEEYIHKGFVSSLITPLSEILEGPVAPLAPLVPTPLLHVPGP